MGYYELELSYASAPLYIFSGSATGGDTFKDFDKCHVCSASRYKNNAGYCGGDNQGPADRNKRKRKGATNSVASVEPPDTTSGISEK